MIYAMMLGGVLIYAALGLVCWALCKAKEMYEREQEWLDRWYSKKEEKQL